MISLEDEYKPIIDKGNELKEVFQFLNVGKPLLITPTMDYHKVLWGITLTNSLLIENKKVRYFSLYETEDNMLGLIKKHHWHLRKNVLRSREAKGTFIEGKKSIDAIVEIINTDKPDVVIIDYFDNQFVQNISQLEEALIKLKLSSIKNETAVVIIYGVDPSNEDIKKYGDAVNEVFRNILENNVHKIISIRDANMVQICEPLI